MALKPMCVVCLFFLAVSIAPAAEARMDVAARLRSADLIAIVNITTATRIGVTNLFGSQRPIHVAEATVERIIKGAPIEKISFQHLAETSPLGTADLCTNPERPNWHLGTRRFLVVLKRAGDNYTTVDLEGDLYSIYGNGSGKDRVSFGGCNSMDDALSRISKMLSK
jgi:hypothetical protein